MLPLSNPGASGPLVLASLEGSAGLSVSGPLSDESSSHLLAEALLVLGTGSGHDSASSSVVDESLDDSGSPVLADGSESLSELESLASSSSLSEGSDDLGSGPSSSEGASSPSLGSLSVDGTELTSVLELLDDLAVGESELLDPLSSLSSHDSGVSSSDDELLHDSLVQVPADSSGLVVLLPDGAGLSSLLEGSDLSGSLPPSEP